MSSEKATVGRAVQTKHRWLVDGIRERIQGLPVGSPLPAERTLAEEFGVARMTVRSALDELQLSGEIVRKRGVGTFASRPKLEHSLRITSFTEEMERLGMVASARYLGDSLTPAGARLGQKLRVSPDCAVWNFGRLRLANREPMAIEWTSIPAELLNGIEPQDFQHESLYRMLQDRFSIQLSGGRQRMEATVTDAEESRLLGIAPHSPALHVERTMWDDNRVVEYVRAIYRGDRYSFTAELHRDRR